MDILVQRIKEQRLHLEILKRVMCVQLYLEKRFHDDLKENRFFFKFQKFHDAKSFQAK